ncbi:outer membrane beta-barrel protein [Acidithiobacillus sulfurivorans]|uniref:outer membrane beta-barrel protein n=1 Tax=Acidithiobacillus sulfurivorans TaxID=1958756 RepID=UPI003F60AC4E
MGKIDVQGIASGMAFYQDDPGTLGAKRVGADITNGMVIIQKENGPIQFYIQAGTYSFPTLASSLASATNTISEYGALPMAYLKIVPSSHFSVEIGKPPSLIGVEDAFTYQNINIERGLLWDMEPTASRGIQFNASEGPLSASLSWNDGDGEFSIDGRNHDFPIAGGNGSIHDDFIPIKYAHIPHRPARYSENERRFLVLNKMRIQINLVFHIVIGGRRKTCRNMGNHEREPAMRQIRPQRTGCCGQQRPIRTAWKCADRTMHKCHPEEYVAFDLLLVALLDPVSGSPR